MACGLLSCAMRTLTCGMHEDLVPRPGIEPGLSALGTRSLTRWTTREVPDFENVEFKTAGTSS